MKIFFLLNPSRSKKIWDYRELAAEAGRRAGAAVRFGQVDRNRPQSTEHLVAQACEEGSDRIVAVGGDGTIHRTINALARLKKLNVEVAVVPAGTCNDLGRSMNLSPKRIERSYADACSGTAQPTDLGVMSLGGNDTHLFINNAGFGRRTQPNAGRRVRPLRTLQSFRPNPVRASWERGSLEGSFFMGLACNAPFFSGGLYFSKAMSINDGLLDVYLFPTMPKWKMLPLLMAGKLGRPVRTKHMIALRVHEFKIDSQTDLWPQADGEPAAKATRRVSFSVSPQKALIVTSSEPRPALWAI